MFVKGKIIYNRKFKAYTHSKIFEIFKLSEKSNYIYQYFQYDSYYTKPTFHETNDFNKIDLLSKRDIMNDELGLEETGEYPSLCCFEKIFENADFIFNNIWENL